VSVPGGTENTDQKQLDRERAAIGSGDRPCLADKADAGGGSKLDKGTSLPDSTTPSSSSPSKTQP